MRIARRDLVTDPRRPLVKQATSPTPTGARFASGILRSFALGEDKFFCADGAPEEVAEKRRKGMDALAESFNKQFAASQKASETVLDGISDLRFTDTNRVPFPFQKLVRWGGDPEPEPTPRLRLRCDRLTHSALQSTQQSIHSLRDAHSPGRHTRRSLLISVDVSAVASASLFVHTPDAACEVVWSLNPDGFTFK